MRRNKVKLPLSLCSGMCHDPSFKKEIVTFHCRISAHSPADRALKEQRRYHLCSSAVSVDALGLAMCWPSLPYARIH